MSGGPADVAASGPRVFESIEELRQHIKQEVAVTGYVDVPQEQIAQFADVTRDRQWIHVDAERAEKESPYRTTVAHGFLTLALIPQFVVEAVKIKGTRMGINFGLNHVRFPSAIPSGSKIRARIMLSAVEDGPNWTQCTWFVTIERQGGKIPSCVAEWLVRYYLK